MTEAEWLGALDPGAMLRFLGDRLTQRKLRLFSVACSRRIWHLLRDDRSRIAVEVAERFADGLATDDERRAAIVGASEATEIMRSQGPTQYYAACSAEDLVLEVRLGLREGWAAASLTGEMETEAQVILLRDIFGNPFRPVSFNPTWLSPTVTTLVNQMYITRDFTPMPILADALEDSACSDQQILDHCRQPGTHVRGCWVIDAILGKE